MTRKHQSSTLLVFGYGKPRWPIDSPCKETMLWKTCSWYITEWTYRWIKLWNRTCFKIFHNLTLILTEFCLVTTIKNKGDRMTWMQYNTQSTDDKTRTRPTAYFMGHIVVHLSCMEIFSEHIHTEGTFNIKTLPYQHRIFYNYYC